MSETEQGRFAPFSSLEIHLLGPFRVIVDGRAIEERLWSRRKPALLIKLLALQPHRQLHREQVMELLWPELEAEAATNNLHKTIHAARRVLEPTLKAGAESHFLLTHGQQVHLRAPGKLWIDAEEFELTGKEALKSSDIYDFVRALELYGGDLLVEDPYEDWIATRRESLRALRQDLLFKLSRLHESQGQHEQSIGRLKEIIAVDPANEDAHRGLMRLYALTGTRQQALHQYQQCCEALRRELNAQPEPATVKLHQQITSGEIGVNRYERLEEDSVQAPQKARSSQKGIPSLLILPLVNVSNDVEMEYFADGVTETIINNLSQLPQLKVIARSTAFRYKGREVDALDVGNKLGVSAVLTGRVMYFKDRLNIQTELVNALDGSQLWGQQYSRTAADIFLVQEEIADEITEKLRLKLSGAERRQLRRRYTENTEAYHAYLRGRFYWNKRDADALKRGADYFQAAIDLDPGYASAYAGLSDSYTLLVVREAVSPEAGFEKAKAAATMALSIDEAFAEAHASLGHAMLHNWEWSNAEVELKRAIELNPGYPSAHHWYSEHLTAMGRCKESITELKLAGELDPLSLIISADLGRAFYYAREYDEVIKQEARTLEMDTGFWLSHINLGRAYTQKRMHAEAIHELEKANELSPDNTEVLSFLAFAYAAAGKSEEALKGLEQLTEQAKHDYVPPYHLAIVYAGLGDKSQAFEWLERAFERHAVDLFTLKVEPMFDMLRADLRYSNLIRRVGL